MPEHFWSLTVREFYLKWNAHVRTEDQRRSLIFEHAMMTGRFDRQEKAAIQRDINRLRRYPLKRWLLPPPPTS